MVEISGNLSVTFRVHELADLQRVLKACETFDGKDIVLSKKGIPATKHHKTVEAEATRNQILQLLKSTFSTTGFAMSEAEELVFTKLGRKSHTTRNAVSWIKKQGIIVSKGSNYYFVDMIQERVATKLKEMESIAVPTGESS